ncbi:MAG: CARDB domain-containing protein [Thermoanaerobaculia bacterium]
MLRIPVILAFLLIPITAIANDLTVTYISRSPDIDYVWDSSNPTREGWPAEGEEITWRAHVRNISSEPVSATYEWRIDAGLQSTGSITIAANGSGTIDLPWRWTFERHRIALTIDPANEIAEESERNNTVEIFSDALSVGLWVEQSFYDSFNLHQHDLGAGSTSFENWAQGPITLYNDEAAMAIYPETPDGVRDRWRLQKIVIVPDGALPLTPIPNFGMMAGEPSGTQMPDRSDRTVDLQWGFRSAQLTVYTDRRTVSHTNPFYLQSSLVHELGHARYLTDVYAWNVQNGAPAQTIDIMENGVPVVGSGLMPTSGTYVHFTPELGLMNQNYTFIDRYSAIALNLIAGRRATRGNYNDPENVGAFLNDLPAQNRLTIRDASGELLRDADVKVYQSTGGADVWYASNYDNTPDLALRTDANGRVLVGRNPFSKDGPVVNYWRASNVVAILRVAAGSRVLYGFLESRLFNLAYWRGETQLADHDLTVGPPLCQNISLPALRQPAYDSENASPNVTLSWTAKTGATNYNVWASANGERPRLLASTTATQWTAYLPGRVYWWVEAEFGDCPPRRSEAWRFHANAARRRRAVR